MTEELSKRARRRPRRFVVAMLVAAVVAVPISLLPGTAAATPARVVPLLNCYYPNGDGSITVVLGYTSTYASTTTIPRGSRNYTTPAAYGSQLPTTFKRGTYNGVVTVRVAGNDVNTTTSWYLDGTTLNYLAAAYAAGTCAEAPLPAFANGAALVIALILAAVVGVLVVRRVRRAAVQSTVPGLPEPTSPGADRA